MSTQSSPLPGWYTDPATPGMLRWWDGHQWTVAQQPLQPPTPPLPPVPPVPPPLSTPPTPSRPPVPLPRHAGKNERLGRLAVVCSAVFAVLAAGALGYLLGVVLDDLARFVDDVRAAPPGEPPPPPGSIFVGSALILLLSALGWLPLILQATWAYRCATAGAALKIPAEHEPVWAAIGWIIPVLSYWFPYQAVRDCLPPDHPRRKTVVWWWAGYLAVSHTTLLVAGMALVSTTVMVIAWIVHAGLAAATAVVGLRVVRAIDEAHREALDAASEPDQG